MDRGFQAGSGKQDQAAKQKKDWEDWGGYMHAKIQKLDQQFIEEKHEVLADRGESGNIFNGVVIDVNGYTVPSADELRRLIGQHGGRFQHYYFSKFSVTHIIATNLPDSKIRALRGEKVVRPEWMLDSIKQGRLLPVEKYLLCTGRKASQTALKFTSTSTSGSLTTTMNSVQEEDEMTKTNRGRDTESIYAVARVTESVERTERNVTMHTQNAKGRTELSSISTDDSKLLENQSLGQDIDDSSNISAQNITDNSVVKASAISPHRKQGGNIQSLPKAGDPNFVSEFYSNSRLHYLSTWGAEFKQFTNQLIKARIAKGIIPSKRPGPGMYGRVVMHIDMDSFFVSVTVRDRPNLVGKPVAVCHAGKGSDSNIGKGMTSPAKMKASSTFFSSMSEIASCSYEARHTGVRNGMFLGPARKLCPDIVCVPYLFDQYREVSQQLYEIFVSYSHDIEAVSCDEAFLDVTHSLDEQTTPAVLAKRIRDEIREATRCNASAGIASSVLLARMCTRLAKPNGQFYLAPDDDIQQFMVSQKVKDLPGVGWALGQKLKDLGVETCADLQKLSLQALQQEFGPKTGLSLHRNCRGIDDRPLRVERERKSVSAEINYGIRFTEDSQAEKFIEELSLEVHKRLQDVGLKGRCITLKLKVRQEGAPMPRKFMGHGICDNIARSSTLAAPTDDPRMIAKECLNLLRQLKISAADLRGMGIQVSKLTNSIAPKTLFDFVKPGPSCDIRQQTEDHVTQRLSAVDQDSDVDQEASEVPGEFSNVDEDMNIARKASTSGIRSFPSRSAKGRTFLTFSKAGASSIGGSRHEIETQPTEKHGYSVRNCSEADYDETTTTNLPTCTDTKDSLPSSHRLQEEETEVIANSFDSAIENSMAFQCLDPTSHNDETPQILQSPTLRHVQGLSSDDSLPPLPRFTPPSLPTRESVESHEPLEGASVYAAETLCLPSPSQIDPTVLEALPLDIRASIEKHYAERNQKLCLRGVDRHIGLGNIPGTTDQSGNQPDLDSCEHGRITNPRAQEYNRHSSIVDQLPSPSQLDPECLAALPEDVQHEILQAYRERKLTTKRLAFGEGPSCTEVGKKPFGKFEHDAQRASRVEEKETPRDRTDAKESYPSQVFSLGGAVSLPDVKAIIREWCYTPVPLDEDVQEVTQYLLQLIEARDLEQMWSIVKYLTRCTRPKGMEDWRPACHDIIDRVQAVIVDKYGARLPIESTLAQCSYGEF